MNKLLALIMVLIPHTIQNEPEVISSFTKENQEIRWYTINDGVMGGLSNGIFQYSENNTGIFKGDISLQNNGGFSWLKAVNNDINLEESEGIVLRVKGDGRKYAFTLKNPDRRRTMYFAADFTSKKNEWEEIKIPLKSFKGFFYGQNVNAISSMNKAKMKEFGIILFDKKQGPFQLEIDWVSTY